MGLSSALGNLLFFLWISGLDAEFKQENCTKYKLQFERVFSVPGDVAMLNSTLVSPDVFDFKTVPYNITWYNLKTKEEISNQTGKILVLQETLWFLNVTLDDDGEYQTILRTPSRCYMQPTRLVVNLPLPGECGRPLKIEQPLTNLASDRLNCPLRDYIYKLDSYNINSTIQWYKSCDPILDGTDRHTYWDRTKLNIQGVEPSDGGTYTCTLTFTFGGVNGSVSESIDAVVKENCANYKLQFERVFSVPGDVAMLNSTLVSPDVFDFKTVPYNITWYNLKTKEEISNQTGKILVLQETLWFLNVTLDDDGEYQTILRTPSRCYMQSTGLVVNLPLPGECGRPLKIEQPLTNLAADSLNCPLRDCIYKLDSYNIAFTIQWYKSCDPILDGTDRHTYWDRTKLNIQVVEPSDSGPYTCTLTFTLGGVNGSVSESIDAVVREEYSFPPQMNEPANEIIKAQMGSNLTKRCLVFVPGVGIPLDDVVWFVRDNLILTTDPSEHIYTTEQRSWSHHLVHKGMYLERLLIISKLKADDFNINYTCLVQSSRGFEKGYFTLLETEPDFTVPIGSVLGGVMVLFIISVTFYYIFRIDIVLWFRGTFPILYPNKDLDGKLYDAYVAYPQRYASGFNEQVETFALRTLPQVLENTCGYKLFIAGRDCIPGQATVDSVEENIQASRRFLLLYTASTFTCKRHTSSTSSNNNNICKSSDCSGNIDSISDSIRNTSFDGSDKVCSDPRQQLECVAAMHKALLEGSFKVVLVELEEISPAQLAFFPESVRHLRKKQGAVCLWKDFRTRQRWRTCTRTEDEKGGGQDSQLSPSLSSSSRFWKEMRYHLPVRGKRKVYPENIALLNA
ncbi:interleukin-1 receptor type 1 isoform X2 [Melanotaenia boesemani]|nr:interleukin-1 receptor type 1 isoform X2 [Melanotaenia boesemani]XP_041858195.1 interleukin-1 receptor type 1 isoform X2 [Melanotaenia boesemani]